MSGGLGLAKERLQAKAEGGQASGVQQLGRGKFWEKPHRGKMAATMEKFNAKAEETKKSLERNPFSDTYVKPEYHPGDDGYGRPESGSKTERRGIAAGESVSQEILQLCMVISERGRKNPDGTTAITFGELFQIYTKISNKVVGVLIRARKHGLLAFEGEVLFQRRDDDVPITLLKSPEQIAKNYAGSGDPSRCLAESTSTD